MGNVIRISDTVLKMRKVLVSIGTLGIGGAEKQAIWLANVLAANDFAVSLLTFKGGQREKDISSQVNYKCLTNLELPKKSTSSSQLFNENYTKVVNIKSFVKELIHWQNPQNLFQIKLRKFLGFIFGFFGKVVFQYYPGVKKFLKIWKFVNGVKPDLVITFLYHDTLLVGLASLIQLKKPKLIVNRRSPSGYGDLNRSRLALLLLRIVYKNSSLAVTNSLSNIQMGIKDGIDSARFVQINNFVESVEKRNSFLENVSPLKLVSVGNLISYKNHKLLLDALSKIPFHQRSFSLDIIGSGPEYFELNTLINKNNVNARLLTEEYNARHLLKNYDVFVLVSQIEGSSNALLEALACGLPSLVSDTGSVPELITMGAPLIVCDIKNVMTISNALMDIKDNYNRYVISSQEFSKKVILHYGEELIRSSWLDEINKLIK